MSGPLMTSVIALFGENSLFAVANTSTNATTPLLLDQICRLNRLPFSTFRSYRDYTAACSSQADDTQRLLQIMQNFTTVLFSDTTATERYLSASMYVFSLSSPPPILTSQKASTPTAPS